MQCIKCGEQEGLTVTRTRYRKNVKTVDYICRFHNAEKKRKEVIRNNTAARRAEKKYRAKYPERARARRLARAHIPLEPCEVCGEKAMRHHPDYAQPLLVRFLCALHHKQVHQGVLCLK